MRSNADPASNASGCFISGKVATFVTIAFVVGSLIGWVGRDLSITNQDVSITEHLLEQDCIAATDAPKAAIGASDEASTSGAVHSMKNKSAQPTDQAGA